MSVFASTVDSVISCVDCGSDNIGAAWSGEGVLKLAWCNKCKATRTPESLPGPAVIKLAAALAADEPVPA